jgi:hypothetical protein
MITRISTSPDGQAYQLAEDAFTSEGGYPARELDPDWLQIDIAVDEHARLMSEFSIRYDGRHYIFEDYRYDRFADAVSYAQLMRARAQPQQEPHQSKYDKIIESPDGLDRRLMKTLHISFSAGVYEFRGYRYDRLVDAVNYARLLANSARKP